MSLSIGDMAGAFLTGVQERSSEIDADLAARMKELSEKKPDDNLKSRFADEYKRWTDDRDTLEAVESAGGPQTEQGQFLLGGYNTIEEYRKAYANDNTLYHKVFEIGQAPVLTPDQYGLTNIRKDGKTRTTVSKLFNKALRPEVYAENQEYEDSLKDVAGSTTTYRRSTKNVNTDEVIAANKDRLLEISKRANAREPENKITINKNVDGVMMTYELLLTNDTDTEAALSAKELGFDGYMVLGDPTRKNVPSDWEKKMEQHNENVPDSNDYISVEDYTDDVQEWQYNYNQLMFGESGRQGPKVGTIISGVYNEDNLQVNVQFTGEDTDSWNGMEGYRLFGKPKPPKSVDYGSTKEYYDKESNSIQQLMYVGGDVDYKGLVGWQTFGDAKAIKDDSISLQTTYNEQGQEVKIYYTGDLKDSWNNVDKGWVQVGDAKGEVDKDWSQKDALAVIDGAINKGITITEKQYESGRFSFMQGKNALEMKTSEALNAYDELVLMVRDFKFMTIGEVIDGKPTGKKVPATPAAISAIAEATGKTSRQIRLKLLKAYNNNKLKNN